MTPAADAAKPTPPWLRRAGLAAGLILLVAAVVTVVGQRETIANALDAVAHPLPGRLAVLAGAVVANIILTGLVFSVLMSRYGRVGLLEMQALIAAASLLNFLPLRPGLFGRIAYHRSVNEIPAVATVKTILQAMALTIAVAAWLAVALALTAFTPAPLWGLVAAPVPVLAVSLVFSRLRIGAAAALLRYLEVMVWAVRYQAAFALLGSPIPVESALAFACVSMVAMLVPLVGNGLGVREWAVGLTAPLLTPYQLQLGLAADLVNRAAELLIILALGLAGVGWIAWHRQTDHRSS